MKRLGHLMGAAALAAAMAAPSHAQSEPVVPLWEKGGPNEFRDGYKWDYSKFMRGERFVCQPLLREGLSEQPREGLRHGQANLRALRFGGGARCKHRPFYFLDQRGDPLTKWRQRQSIGSAQHQRRTECALQC